LGDGDLLFDNVVELPMPTTAGADAGVGEDVGNDDDDDDVCNA